MPLNSLLDKPLGEWRLCPPEVVVAQNGFVLRQYDIHSDQMTLRIALDADELQIALNEWAESVCNDLRRMVERRLEAAKPKEHS